MSLVVDYDYFERSEPMVFDEQGTYVETDAKFGPPSHTCGITGSARS